MRKKKNQRNGLKIKQMHSQVTLNSKEQHLSEARFLTIWHNSLTLVDANWKVWVNVPLIQTSLQGPWSLNQWSQKLHLLLCCGIRMIGNSADSDRLIVGLGRLKSQSLTYSGQVCIAWMRSLRELAPSLENILRT